MSKRNGCSKSGKNTTSLKMYQGGKHATLEKAVEVFQRAHTNDPSSRYIDTGETSYPITSSTSAGSVFTVLRDERGEGKAVAFHPLLKDAAPAISPNIPTQTCYENEKLYC
jgi:hypothetical protein